MRTLQSIPLTTLVQEVLTMAHLGTPPPPPLLVRSSSWARLTSLVRLLAAPEPRQQQEELQGQPAVRLQFSSGFEKTCFFPPQNFLEKNPGCFLSKVARSYEATLVPPGIKTDERPNIW